MVSHRPAGTVAETSRPVDSSDQSPEGVPMTGSKTDVRKYASGWVVTHPGETRCDFERSFRTHGEAMEFATNHALACLHTLERRREENRRLAAQAIENADLYGVSAHRDVVRLSDFATTYHGKVTTNPEPTEPIEVPWDQIVRVTGRTIERGTLADRLRRAAGWSVTRPSYS